MREHNLTEQREALCRICHLLYDRGHAVGHDGNVSLRVGEGEMFFRVEARDEPACRVLLQGLKLHLTGLEEQYPDHMRVGYLEV